MMGPYTALDALEAMHRAHHVPTDADRFDRSDDAGGPTGGEPAVRRPLRAAVANLFGLFARPGAARPSRGSAGA